MTRAALFPDPPREFPGQRLLKVSLRAAHVLCAGVFAATYVLDEPTARDAWLVATVASGGAILAADLYQSAAFLLQTRGLVLLAKLVVVAALPHSGSAAPWLVSALVVGSVLSSHAPSRVRYFVWVGRGRVKGDESRG